MCTTMESDDTPDPRKTWNQNDAARMYQWLRESNPHLPDIERVTVDPPPVLQFGSYHELPRLILSVYVAIPPDWKPSSDGSGCSADCLCHSKYEGKGDEARETMVDYAVRLPPVCSTCDGGGCLDCSDRPWS